MNTEELRERLFDQLASFIDKHIDDHKTRPDGEFGEEAILKLTIRTVGHREDNAASDGDTQQWDFIYQLTRSINSDNV